MRSRLATLLLCFAVLYAIPGQAQDTRVPNDPIADSLFTVGLQAYQAGRYTAAYTAFEAGATMEPAHRKTTASWLMAGKALYSDNQYQAATNLLERFITTYPTSGYLDEAQQTIALATIQQTQQNLDAQTLHIGVLLSLSNEDAPLTQALFNGVRLAVDAHNTYADSLYTNWLDRFYSQALTASPDSLLPAIQMHFQDISNGDIQGAVFSLARKGCSVIIGPLYSEEADVAGRAAEQARVVLVAPLATDESVTRNRRYVFQANPSFTMRGRLMARMAINGLRINEFGIIAEENDPFGQRMAEGFQEEAMQLGAEVIFYKSLSGSGGWYRLPELVRRDTLSYARGVYMPITGGNAPTLIGAALTGLDRMATGVRVLGNAEWHNLPITLQASSYSATYTNDHYVDETVLDVQHFISQYLTLNGETPSRLGYIGYDVSAFLIKALLTRPDTIPLHQHLHQVPAYQGLGHRFNFSEGNVNSTLFYHRYRDGALEMFR